MAFRAFHSRMLDYAGIFPPASLSLDAAIKNYSKYRKINDKWMQSRFICPASRLSELAFYRDSLFNQQPPFVFSILGRGGNSEVEFFNNLKRDLHDINEFQSYHGKLVKPEMFETKIPIQVENQSPNQLTSFFSKLQSEIVLNNFDEQFQIFLEVTSLNNKNWKETLSSVIHEIKTANQELNSNFGLKLRTGGVTPAAYPSVDLVAYTIHNTITDKIPLKATAGLHQPITKINTENKKFKYPLNVMMFGFINIIGAVVLGSQGLSIELIQEIIQEKNQANFVFSNTTFKWKSFEASVEQIEEVRKNGFISFGSCDFDEPREDLIQLGLL